MQSNTLVKSTLQATLLLAVLTSVSSCLKPASSKYGNQGGSTKLTSVNMQLPSSSVFKPTSGDATVNAIRLVVTPIDSKCEDATKIDQINDYDDTTISKQFVKNCDYTVILALGEKDTDGDFKPYYQNAFGQRVSKADLQTSPAKISLSLKLTEEGKAANMPASIVIPQSTDNEPTTDTQKSANNSQTQLSENFSQARLVGPGSKETTLNEVFTSQYLLINYSQIGCSYCVQHAMANNVDSELQKMMTNSPKCKGITVVDSTTLSSWTRQFDRDPNAPTTFTGKTSYGYSGGATRFASLFKTSITGTPTIHLVDRTGKIVVADARSNPSAINQYCQ